MLKILLKSRLLALADQFAGQTKGKKAAQLGTWIALAVLGVLLLVNPGQRGNQLEGVEMSVVRALGVPGAEIVVQAPYFAEYRAYVEPNGIKLVVVPPD